MKKIAYSLIVFLSVLRLGFSVGEWDSVFRNRQLTYVEFPLSENQTLFWRIPPGFKYAYSDEDFERTILEFIPVTDRIGNWSELITILMFESCYSTGAFQQRANAMVRSIPDKYEVQFSGGSIDGIDCFDLEYETPAVQFPQMARIPGKTEFYRWRGFHGPEGFYIVQYVIRAPNNLSSREYARIQTRLLRFIEDLQIVTYE